ncbi:MAG: pitrilysin family protein [Coriobacteriales bacterium]|nr:insulinase family protein [Actinomycetes bacterium]
MAANDFQKTVTSSGVEVITETIDSVRSAAIGIWVNVGSRDEAPHEAGMSHFMEHMMFKGTPTRTAADISEHFERLGGELNAFTSKEYTCFYARVLDEHMDSAIEVLSDMVVNSLLADDAILSEREVVLEEISRHEDTPDDAVHDLFTSALMADHPLGLPVLGSPQTVGSFDHAASATFKDRMYVSGNTVVAVAGHVDHGRVVEAVDMYLALPQGARLGRDARRPEPVSGLTVVTKNTEQAHICWGVPAMDARSEERFTLAILDSILGGGMASRLFQEIREKRGMAYAVYSYHSLYYDTGQYTVYAGTRPSNAEEVVKLIREQADALAADGVTAEELTRAKESFKGQLVLSLESTRNRMTRLGKSEVTQSELLSTDELVARVDAVTADDVHVLAARLFSQPQVLTMIAPFSRDDMSDLLD